MKNANVRFGFTLLELLVVVAIMGLLGTVATGGYRAMVRGMEERGVMQNVNAFVRAAYQRAQIDRQPTVVYFWNETIRSRTEDAFEVVVGKAVAVRRAGRITRKDGSILVDEFADLNLTFMSADEQESLSGNGARDMPMDLYPMDRVTSSGLRRSQVRGTVVRADDNVQFLGGFKNEATASGGKGSNDNVIPGYGFVLEDANGVSWKQGMAYGFEFARLQLPDGYIFGNSHSSDAGNPITEAGTLVFDVGRNDNSGRNTGGVVGSGSIAVCVLRQQGMSLNAVKIDDSDSPDRKMY